MSKEKIRLADLRENYQRGGLSEGEVSADPFVQFESWFNDAVEAGAGAFYMAKLDWAQSDKSVDLSDLDALRA